VTKLLFLDHCIVTILSSVKQHHLPYGGTKVANILMGLTNFLKAELFSFTPLISMTLRDDLSPSDSLEQSESESEMSKEKMAAFNAPDSKMSGLANRLQTAKLYNKIKILFKSSSNLGSSSDDSLDDSLIDPVFPKHPEDEYANEEEPTHEYANEEEPVHDYVEQDKLLLNARRKSYSLDVDLHRANDFEEQPLTSVSLCDISEKGTRSSNKIT
jgi:hypothetical protein